jgi:hypothetical protein
MANNLPKHMYPARDANGAIRAPPFATQFEDMCNIVNQLLLKLDGEKAEPPAFNKQYSIPSVLADAVSEGDESVDENATPV